MLEQSVLSRIKAIYELAQRGEQGEADNARRSLELHLKKYKVTIEEILDHTEKSDAEDHIFWEPDPLFRSITIAIIRHVAGVAVYSYLDGRRKNNVIANLTLAQFVDVSSAIAHYRTIFLKESDLFLQAFVYKFELYSTAPITGDEQFHRELSFAELAALKEMIGALRGKRYVAGRKRLEPANE